MCLNAVRWRMLAIYSCRVHALGHCDLYCGLGLVSMVCTINIFMITLPIYFYTSGLKSRRSFLQLVCLLYG